MNRLGLEQLTVLGMPPVDYINLAADLGCASISTALGGLPMSQFGHASVFPDWSLQDDPALQRDTKAALRDRGITIALGEGFIVRPGSDVRDAAQGLDLMAELGTERINTVSMDPDLARTHDQMALLCDMVIERGMKFTIEFAPPNTIDSLASALEAIDHIGGGKCRLLVDSMHLFRSGGTLADLTALDPDLIGYVQLCDVPLVSAGGTYMEEAIFSRMIPGTGELPLREFIAAVPAGVRISLEVPMLAELQAKGSPRDTAARAVAAARELGV